MTLPRDHIRYKIKQTSCSPPTNDIMAVCLHKARNYVTESTAADQICKNGPESGQIKCRKTKTWHPKPHRHEYSSYKFHSLNFVELNLGDT